MWCPRMKVLLYVNDCHTLVGLGLEIESILMVISQHETKPQRYHRLT